MLHQLWIPAIAYLAATATAASLPDTQVLLAPPEPGTHIPALQIPSEEEAATVARTLVQRESLTNINTIRKIHQDDGTTRALPFSAMEYYADCDEDGDPYWLAVDIGTTFQNLRQGSDVSFTIRVGDHPAWDEVNATYPGGIEQSPAGSPRINLSGRLNWVPFKTPFDYIRLQACFLKRHPDAVAWLPGSYGSPHSSRWAKLEVDAIYFVGGFGDRAYIGAIDPELYHAADVIEL
ncbi:uncharacterized protein CANTADRAFT_88505 [Suhomyces tanzawaensis NRRL Y-17324]|uniref:CREG-like beta-barrel domain-containing protein n=1 Tax=Suhomyces tanzawaensis NRRL Y-17324 TaxID=984487 RepID=A0A1E4SM24_9ASCO|nr:uncharacterized protein CANTADRAFT_88505 [Suhomyces tanzawaensis NRRL Y-17324]ODV80576.1 hypothetical protein CANTADRAFT_88505 [Suhomyces tanzawaensis NRRL Y-17324]